MPRGVPPVMDDCGAASHGAMGSGDVAVQKGRVREIPTGGCLDVCFGVGMFSIFIFWKRAPTVCFQLLRGYFSTCVTGCSPLLQAQVPPEHEVAA